MRRRRPLFNQRSSLLLGAVLSGACDCRAKTSVRPDPIGDAAASPCIRSCSSGICGSDCPTREFAIGSVVVGVGLSWPYVAIADRGDLQHDAAGSSIRVHNLASGRSVSLPIRFCGDLAVGPRVAWSECKQDGTEKTTLHSASLELGDHAIVADRGSRIADLAFVGEKLVWTVNRNKMGTLVDIETASEPGSVVLVHDVSLSIDDGSMGDAGFVDAGGGRVAFGVRDQLRVVSISGGDTWTLRFDGCQDVLPLSRAGVSIVVSAICADHTEVFAVRPEKTMVAQTVWRSPERATCLAANSRVVAICGHDGLSSVSIESKTVSLQLKGYLASTPPRVILDETGAIAWLLPGRVMVRGP